MDAAPAASVTARPGLTVGSLTGDSRDGLAVGVTALGLLAALLGVARGAVIKMRSAAEAGPSLIPGAATMAQEPLVPAAVPKTSLRASGWGIGSAVVAGMDRRTGGGKADVVLAAVPGAGRQVSGARRTGVVPDGGKMTGVGPAVVPGADRTGDKMGVVLVAVPGAGRQVSGARRTGVGPAVVPGADRTGDKMGVVLAVVAGAGRRASEDKATDLVADSRGASELRPEPSVPPRVGAPRQIGVRPARPVLIRLGVLRINMRVAAPVPMSPVSDDRFVLARLSVLETRGQAVLAPASLTSGE
jgi:hypothetical protein